MKRRKNDLEEGNRPTKKLLERQSFFVAWRQVARQAGVVKDIENEQKRQVEVAKDIEKVQYIMKEQKRSKVKRRKTFPMY